MLRLSKHCAMTRALESAFGESFEWEPLEGKQACRIALYRPGSVEDSVESLEEYHRWAVERLLRFQEGLWFGVARDRSARRQGRQCNVVIPSGRPTLI